jgi:hypothetical protein
VSSSRFIDYKLFSTTLSAGRKHPRRSLPSMPEGPSLPGQQLDLLHKRRLPHRHTARPCEPLLSNSLLAMPFGKDGAWFRCLCSPSCFVLARTGQLLGRSCNSRHKANMITCVFEQADIHIGAAQVSFSRFESCSE